ncbi:bifunctional tetrahydrofolate synthase/dihydrofolate synthase [Proteobacteria bacterium 005FR1]|nr:bifunctional tetrahydrofolate synthase/dihydrofolate synthase [Proteobacteria bacterium 005FR1]
MRFKTLPDWLKWLESLHPKSIELGLDRLRRVAARLPEIQALQAPQRRCRIVTIAGTNGKGSCVATLEALCLAANQSVGAYTSPHLLRYNERIRIDGEPVGDEQIIAAFQQIDQAREDISLTYFEFGTLAALLLFTQAGVDNLILEVGLGGRLDAVNLIDPDVAVVTSIDLDHQEWLGDNRESIGREKAGVFRSGRPAICVDLEPPASVANIANEQHAELLLAGREINWFHAAGGWTWHGLNSARQPTSFTDLPLPHLPLPSVVAAVQAFLLLGNKLTTSKLTRVLRNIQLPGRCQRVYYHGRNLILDVAHNPAAADYLAERLASFSSRRTIAVFAVMADKDYGSMISALSRVVDDWFVCGLPGIPRAAGSEELLAAVAALGQRGERWDTVEQALAAAVDSTQEGDQILVAGSFYTVAAVLALLESENRDTRGQADG